jgi:membrane-associated protease RseP (regulator of RpoE activity)
LVTEPFIQAHGLMLAFPQRRESPLGAGIGGETRYAFARARSVLLLDATKTGSGARLADPVVGLSVRGTLREHWIDGLLGAEFLRGYRVIFDYSRHRLILEQREPAVAAAEYDMSGMFVVSEPLDHHRFVVHEILANGPAAAAGVAVGDRIISVDGLPAAQLTLGELRNVLRSQPGRVVELTVEREGQALHRTIRHVRLV